MDRHAYDAIDTLAYDPAEAGRNALRASLNALGFRKVELPATLKKLEEIVRARPVDFLLCEVSGGEAGVCRFIQWLRQDDASRNPFAVVIATTRQSDSAIVGRVLNAGADDLLVRPYETSLLAERVRAQVERRKGFVVTLDYVGPDRRRDPARSGPECIAVPNSLKIKSVSSIASDLAERKIAAEIREGRSAINRERLRRNAFQLCVQWRLLEQRRSGGPVFAETVARMRVLAGEIRRRAKGMADDFAAKWCQSVEDSLHAIVAMSEAVKNASDDSLLDLGPPTHLLGQAAMALGQKFAPRDVQPGRLVELDALVARIDSRSGEETGPAPRRAAAGGKN